MRRASAVRTTVCVAFTALGVARAPLWAADVPPTVPPATQVAPPAEQADAEVRALEEKERVAMLHGDAEALSRIWGPSLLITAPGNKIRTGAEVLAFVKEGSLKYTTLERRIERVSIQGSVAIVMGGETVVRTAGPDAGKKVERRFTDVFTRQDNQWRLIGRQVSNVPAQP